MRGLQLLLAICRSRNLSVQRQQLAYLESRDILEQVEAETMEIADEMGMLQEDSSVGLDVDQILLKSRAYMRVRKEKQVEGYPRNWGDLPQTTASLMIIADLLSELVDYGKDQSIFKHERLAINQALKELLLKVKSLRALDGVIVRTESSSRYAGLPALSKSGRQIEYEKTTEMLESIRSSIGTTLHELRPTYGFSCTTQRLSIRDKKQILTTIEKVKEWTTAVDSILSQDYFQTDIESNDRISD